MNLGKEEKEEVEEDEEEDEEDEVLKLFSGLPVVAKSETIEERHCEAFEEIFIIKKQKVTEIKYHKYISVHTVIIQRN